MNSEMSAYGLWSLVIVNSVIFILFAYTLLQAPNRPRVAVIRSV